MADIAIQPVWQVLDGNGNPYPGAKASFFVSGTTTPLTAYTDVGLSVAHAVPVVANGNGVFPPIYLGSTAAKVVITTSAGAAISTVDPVPKTTATATGASQVSFSPTADIPSLTVQAAIEKVQANLVASSTAYAKTLLAALTASDAQTVLGISAFVKTLLDDADASAFLTTLGMSTFVKTLIDDADALAFLTTLGFGVSGSAPLYAARAWVKFAGATGTVTASGNVTSVTRSSAGIYTVNFTTALQDANYVPLVMTDGGTIFTAVGTQLTTACAINTRNNAGTLADPTTVYAAFLR